MEHGTADAYRTLYLLPTAPRQLVTEVYRRLAGRFDGDAAVLEEMDAAYAAVLASNGTPPPEPDDVPGVLPAHQSPWDLLHLAPGAPPEAVAVAYQYWRREQGPIPEEAHEPDATAGTEAADSVDERIAALAATRSERRTQSRSAAPGEANLVDDAEGQQEMRAVIGPRPLRVGTDPSCDVTVAAPEGGGSIEARIWPRGERFMLHVLDGGAVRLNGARAVWAVLEDGDRLQVGDQTYRFERPRPDGALDGQPD